MGVITRGASPYWWVWVPGLPEGKDGNPFNTKIPRHATTSAERKTNRQLAEQILATRLVQIGKAAAGLPEPVVEPDTVLLTTWATTYQAQEIPKHRGAYRELQMLPRLVSYFGDLALTSPAKAWIGRADAYREMRLTTPTTVDHYGGPNGKPHTFPRATARTVNREVNFLKQMLACAVEKQLVDISPLLGYKALKGGTIRRRLTPENEEARLLPILSPVDRAIYLIARDGLVRLGDAIDARRDDDHGTTFFFPCTKNGDPVTIPITARLRATLDVIPVDPANPEYYFPHRRVAKLEKDRSAGYARAVYRACRDAKPPIPYGKKNNGLTFHWSTRTTGATKMIRVGGDGVIADVAKIGGWRDTGVLLEIYQDVVTEDMQRIAELASGAAISAPAPPPSRRRTSKLRRVK